MSWKLKSVKIGKMPELVPRRLVVYHRAMRQSPHSDGGEHEDIDKVL